MAYRKLRVNLTYCLEKETFGKVTRSSFLADVRLITPSYGFTREQGGIRAVYTASMVFQSGTILCTASSAGSD